MNNPSSFGDFEMPTIKNTGKRDRMVADRILKPGDSKPITVKQAELFADDADFEIMDLTDPNPCPPPKSGRASRFGGGKNGSEKNRGRKK
jgi:hypothetical protein